MKKVNELFNNLGKKVYGYEYRNGDRIVETDDGQYFVKDKSGNVEDLYQYLISRDFPNFLNIENNYSDCYEIYRYETDNVVINDKAIDMVYLLSKLHLKTTTYRKVDLDNVKKVYETVSQELEQLNNYYHSMQDYIETKVYMSPAEYLLIRNISSIYYILSLSKDNIDKWYEAKANMVKERVALVHNNLSLDNFIDLRRPVFKNWEKSKKDFVVYDFYNFYKNNYKDLEFSSLFEIYQSKYKFTDDEYLLFKALIFKVWEVELVKSNYDNCIIVNDLVAYINKTLEFFLEENKKDKKADNDEFN